MPTTYTHYRFGDRCLAAMSPALRLAAGRSRALYDIGVHGPDLFFYYHPLKANEVSAYGNRLHRQTARTFFEKVRPVWQAGGSREEMLAYLLGFLSHFVLDSACHGYVEEARKELGISHNKLEAYFDAYLMRADGLTPSRVDRGASLRPSAGRAALIARFFDFPPETVLAASKGQVRVMRLLYSPTGAKKQALRALIRRFGIRGSFDDLFIDDAIPESCRPAMEVLDGLFAQALAEYPALAEALVHYLDGSAPLPERFDRDFE